MQPNPDPEDDWEFIIMPDKSKVWISQSKKQVSFRYPHIEELKEHLEKFRSFMKKDTEKPDRHLKTKISIFDLIFSNEK